MATVSKRQQIMSEAAKVADISEEIAMRLAYALEQKDYVIVKLDETLEYYGLGKDVAEQVMKDRQEAVKAEAVSKAPAKK